ncbi:fasciclin domain-containing protein [Alienimonas californiensis]|uniref:Immunogenic protein MPT70 n=1 Tax=Alienimonas californiensis TaxID=2527989 RepID=A0A517P578_9PLAN|nr:fasciclin domain-containing protein [Alienimonas californiensis]QDT14537.1 Immunogenic protein MPT70 precursor [Alienimonas californiensis]
MRSFAKLFTVAAAAGCVGLLTAAAPAPVAPVALDHHEEGASKNIVETAQAAGSFKTLLTAAKEAGLAEALSAKDANLTVFAPTDEAFAKLPEGALEGLLKDKEALKSVLLYHVVKGKVKAEDVVGLDGQKVETLSGKKVNVKVKDGVVMLNKSKVVKADVMASNGVIHVIDTVLMPPKGKAKDAK